MSIASEIVDINRILDRVVLVQTQEREGSKIRLGGYSITYDRHGNEISRTENTWHVSLECHTEQEANRLSRAT